MSKIYACSNCGMELKVTYRSLPKIQKTIRLVDYHECGETVSLESMELLPPVVPEGKNEFVQNLNDLHEEKSVETARVPGWPQDERPNPVDLREPTSTAPKSTVDSLFDEFAKDTKRSPDPRMVGEEGDDGNEG